MTIDGGPRQARSASVTAFRNGYVGVNPPQEHRLKIVRAGAAGG
jgi:hypothetical protein